MKSPFIEVRVKVHKTMQIMLFVNAQGEEGGSPKFLFFVNSCYLEYQFLSSKSQRTSDEIQLLSFILKDITGPFQY